MLCHTEATAAAASATAAAAASREAAEESERQLERALQEAEEKRKEALAYLDKVKASGAGAGRVCNPPPLNWVFVVCC